MRLVLHKKLRPERNGDPFIYLEYTGEMQNVPAIGSMIRTGKLETQIGGVSFDRETGWFAAEWSTPNLGDAIKDVQEGRTTKQVLKEYLDAGWKVVDAPGFVRQGL